jgi:acyl-CoA thioesterase-1
MKFGKWMLLFSIVASSAIAQDGPARQDGPAARARSRPPAFQAPEVKPGLPNVLLIGDSISIGYMIPARQALEAEANVWRPPVNCGPTTRGLESLESWLGDRKWDVIHFNFGLHDLKYLGPNNKNLADPDAATSHQQVPIDQYAENLRKIATRLKQTGATVIWCQTTPVPEGAQGRVPGDAQRYNEAAAKVMSELDVRTDPLFDVASENAKLQRPANVHYTPEGSEVLGKQVAKAVRSALSERQLAEKAKTR